MKRNETSARGASKTAPVKNAGSRRLRSLTAAAFIVMTGVGLAWHTGWGTLSSFGIVTPVPHDYESLSNEVRALCEDADQNLWYCICKERRPGSLLNHDGRG